MATESAQQAWQALADFWKPFDFMLTPGTTPDEISSWEKAQSVTLQTEVKELIGVHSYVGIPAAVTYGYPCAETALSSIAQWVRFDQSILNKQMDDPSFWPGVFADSGCPSTDMKDYTVVGSDPWGADYGIYIMLYQSQSLMFSINWNIPEVKPLGDMTTWLAEHRLAGLEDVAAYKAGWNDDNDDAGGAGLAKSNRFYLNIGYPERLALWTPLENQFIAAFDAIPDS